MPYKVGKYPGVAAKMRTLADLASLAGMRQSYLEVLKLMAERLESDPMGWGDPLYRVPHQSGIVHHAIAWPIQVRYSVHEAVAVVLIMDIDPVFDWPLRP